MSGNKLSSSQEIKVSGKLFKWEVNLFLNGLRQQVTNKNFLRSVFLIIQWLLPNGVKPSIKSETKHGKQYDFQNLLKITNTISKSCFFEMICEFICFRNVFPVTKITYIKV